MSEEKCDCSECKALEEFKNAFNGLQTRHADRISQLEAQCAAMRDFIETCKCRCQELELAESNKTEKYTCSRCIALSPDIGKSLLELKYASFKQISQLESDCASYRRAILRIEVICDGPSPCTDRNSIEPIVKEALSLSAGREMLEEHKAEVQDAKNRAECFREGCYTLRANVESCRETITELQESLARTVKGTQGDICPACGTEFEKGEFQRCGGSIIKEVVDLRAKLAESERVRSDDESAILLLGKRLALAERVVGAARSITHRNEKLFNALAAYDAAKEPK